MKQSSFIFGAILIAFLIYITVRNQLPEYLALFSSESKVISETVSDNNLVDFEENPYTKNLNKVIENIFSQAGF